MAEPAMPAGGVAEIGVFLIAMSDEYYDSKGIRHYSKERAESANERYLCEERRAREQAVEQAREQTQIQAEQLRQQLVHQDQVHRELKEQARKEEAHRQFIRDIQWLERCDPKGKLEFLARTVRDKFEDALAGEIAVYLSGSSPNISGTR